MINNTKTEEDLMNLKGFSSRPKVHGSICNLWFSCLRNRYPWEYLLFSQDNNNQDYYKNQIKAKIVGSFYKKIELIVSGTLTQESVDELNSILKELKNLRKPNIDPRIGR